MFTVVKTNRFAETPSFIQKRVLRKTNNPVRVGLYGFEGRSSKAMWLSTLGNPFISIVHINGTAAPALADKMNFDSIYGKLSGLGYYARVSSFDKSLMEIVNLNTGNVENNIIVTSNNKNLPDGFWVKNGVEVLIDRTEEYKTNALMKHIEKGGVKKVITKYAGNKFLPHVLPFLVPEGDEKILSTASCMANCMALPIKALHSELGVKSGFINVVHGYMAEQNLVDEAREDKKFTRSAVLNTISMRSADPTIVGRMIPGLKNRLGGFCLTVPVPVGSTALLNLDLKKNITRDNIRDIMLNFAENEFYQFMEYSHKAVVSSDVIGSTYSCIFDGENIAIILESKKTKAGKHVALFAWCDNLMGYSARTRDLAILAGQNI